MNPGRIVKLGEYIEILSGYAFKSSYFNENRLGMPLIRIRDVFSNNLKTFYSGEYKEEYVVKKGDLLITMDGEFKIKKWEAELGLLNQRVCKITSSHRSLETDYLLYLLPAILKKIEDRTPYVTVKHLSVKDIKESLISLPPIETQKKIVRILKLTQDTIEKRKSQIAALDELAQSTFLEMFGDPKENKNQYPVRSLVDFYESQKDGVKCGPFGSALKKDEYTNCGTPVWNMDNITKSNSFIDQPNLFVSEKKAIQLRSYNVQNGDIIISRAGTVGKMGVVRSKYKNSLISTNLIRLRLNKELIPEFLVILIGIFGDKVCRMRTGSEGSFTHMNTSVLNSMEFPVPPLEKQKQFIKFLESIEEQNLKFMAALNEMQFLYNSLLQKAFRGELIQEK